MPDMSGYAKLGAVFAGGDNAAAYSKGKESAARVETLLAEARIKRDEAMQREKFRDNAIAAGVPAAQADLLSSTFGAGYNPEQLSGYQTDMQKIGLTDEAATAARGGDIGGLNDLMTVLSGKPRERTAITGGMAYDAFAAPDQAMQVTPVGAADIGATNALASQRYADAGESTAHAALYGRTDPNIRGTGSAAKPATYSAPSATSVTTLLGDAEGNVDTTVARDFQVWRSANPQYRNGEEALAAYVTQGSSSASGSKAPVIIDPSLPGSMTQRPPSPEDVSLESVLRGDGLSPELVTQIAAAAESGQDFNVPTEMPRTQEAGMQALAEAREAVKRGADPEAVRARMKKMGFVNLAGRL